MRTSILILLLVSLVAYGETPLDFPPPSTQATISVSSSTGVWTCWQHVPSVPKHIERAVAFIESSDNPDVGLHDDGTSIGWHGITPGFVQMLIDAGWIPRQKYNLYNGWENRWIFRRGLQYFYRDSRSWEKALSKFHGASIPSRNSEYVNKVMNKAREVEATDSSR